VQDGELKALAPSEVPDVAKPTVPVGVTVVGVVGLASPSVTVAVHTVEPWVFGVTGTHETAVVLVRNETVRPSEPLLAPNVVALPG